MSITPCFDDKVGESGCWFLVLQAFAVARCSTSGNFEQFMTSFSLSVRVRTMANRVRFVFTTHRNQETQAIAHIA